MTHALNELLRPDATVRDSLDRTVELLKTLDAGASCETNENAEAAHRLFYRGVIDYDLVDNAGLGMKRLVIELVERFAERKTIVDAAVVDAALTRIEEEAIIDSEEILWQVTDPDRMAELFEQVKGVLEEMDKEKRFRRTVYYDEWDSKIGDYRKDWVRVREMDTPETSTAFYDRTVSEQYGLVSCAAPVLQHAAARPHPAVLPRGTGR